MFIKIKDVIYKRSEQDYTRELRIINKKTGKVICQHLQDVVVGDN